MDSALKRLFTLAHCKEMSNHVLYKLVCVDPTLAIFYTLNDIEWKRYFNLSTEKVYSIKRDYESFQFKEVYEFYHQKKYSFVPVWNETYPRLLKEIIDPPPFLFFQGDLSLASNQKIIGVVGTRYPSQYGVAVVQDLLTPLVKNGWVIVSGLAKGIDTLGHISAIDNGGKTIAVIGGGLQHIYPRENIQLAGNISTSHLILSEHPPNKVPQKWHFPLRNRIISGLAPGTLVVQAKKRSGSLITAQQALEQNREVFAVPGSIFDDCSSGTNELIQSGAKLVQKVEDIVEELTSALIKKET